MENKKNILGGNVDGYRKKKKRSKLNKATENIQSRLLVDYETDPDLKLINSQLKVGKKAVDKKTIYLGGASQLEMNPENKFKNQKRTMRSKGKKKKRKKKVLKETEFAKENRAVVSTERIFTIEEDLKETLKSSSASGFSFLQLFGTSETQHSELQDNEVLDVKNSKLKPEKSLNNGPELPEVQEINLANPNKPEKPTNASKEERFFISANDPRFQGVLEFINGAPEEVNFGEKRKALKKLVLNKHKNSQRKKKMFKKKLGRNKINI